MNNDWEKVDQSTGETLIQEINAHIEPVPFQVETTTLRKMTLPFYDDYDFYELTDLAAVPGVRKYALYKKGDVHVIDWTNQVIYDTNENAPIILNDKNVLAYIKFFFNYVRGRHGRFLIVENVDDIRWQSEPPPQGRKVIQEMLKPVTILEKQEDGTYICEAYMIFKDSLFKAMCHVSADGMVSLTDEELRIEGMPITPDTAQS